MSTTHCQCRQMDTASVCYDFNKQTSEGTICTERSCDPSYKCDCGPQAQQFCKIVSSTRQIYKPTTPIADKSTYCVSATTTSEGAEVLEGATVPALKPLTGTDAEVGIWTDTQCACSLKSSMGPVVAGTCAVLSKMVGGNAFCTSRECKASDPAEMVCDIDGKSTCSRKKYNQDIYVLDNPEGPTVGEVPCQQKSVQKESVVCETNCATP